jgi:hypothetical protein
VIFADGIEKTRQDKFIDEPSGYETLPSFGEYNTNRGGTKKIYLEN